MISNGISKLDLKRRNRMEILRLLRRNGPTSRIDIAREIGITKAAVTIITNEMISDGILYEKGEQRDPEVRATRGRKKILLDICATYKMDIGIVLEGRQIYAGVATLWGDVVEKQTVPVAAGASREEILSQIENVYRQLLYKNDLKAGQITGVGVCIDPRFYPVLQMKAAPSPDYSDFAKWLKNFIQVPVTFARVVEGAAMAEMDYWQKDAEPADEFLLFRCNCREESAVVIAQELYRGTSGGAMYEPDTAGLQREEAFWKQVEEIFSEEKSPALWTETNGSINRMRNLFRQGKIPVEEPAIMEVIRKAGRNYAEWIRTAVRVLDPGKVFLLAIGGGEEAIYTVIQEQMREVLPELAVARSSLREENLFLAGAALATREFFGNRGGY